MQKILKITFSILILNSAFLTALPRVKKINKQPLIEQFAKTKSPEKGFWLIKNKVYHNKAGYFFITSDFTQPIGYRGVTAILIWLSSNKQRLLAAKIIASDDTPAYIKLIMRKKHLQKYKGRSITALLHKQKTSSIDVISGATRSCEGIYFSIVQSLRKVTPLIKCNNYKG